MLISILRRPEGLFALTGARAAPFVVPGSGAELGASLYTESVCPLAELEVPLQEVFGKAQPTQEVFGKAQFTQEVFGKAQLTLKAVSQASPQVLAAVLCLLAVSTSEPNGFLASLPVLRFDEAKEPSRRSAAKPRGFKGTKYRPPKTAASTPQVLLPYLDGGNQEAELLRLLGAHLDEAVALCNANAGDGLMFERADPSLLRPYGQAWPKAVLPQIASLPDAFRKYFLGSLRGLSYSSVKPLIACYWSLGLGSDSQLRTMAAMMIAQSPATTIPWLAALEYTTRDRRHCLAELMLETGAFKIAHHAPATLVRQLDELCFDEDYRHRAYHLLVRVRCGYPEQYLLDGFQLANRYYPDCLFHSHGEGHNVFQAVEKVMKRLQDHPEEWQRTRFALTLWQRCGELEKLSETLDGLVWGELDSESICYVVDFLGSVVYHAAEMDEKGTIWDCIQLRSANVLELLKGVQPEYREKAYLWLSEIVWIWNDAERLATLLDDYFRLMPRLCAPPFAFKNDACNPLSSFTRLPEKWWHAIQKAPESSFLALEKASRRANDAYLIGMGLWSLAKYMPQRTVEVFLHGPSALCRTAKTLGCLSNSARARLLIEAQKTPLFCVEPDTLDPEALVELIDADYEKPSAYISKRLRAHVQGRATMTEGQLQRAVAQIVSRWSQLLNTRLHELALQSMGQLYPDLDMDDPQIRHAVMLQFSTTENRRALRKMLKAQFSGDHQYLSAHPETQNWFKKHPAIDALLWQNGIVLQPTASVGEVELTVERDVLEVLRMGTYVGTCLGLGGGMAYSAAAVVLDANKQVVYCRDVHGTVLARQIIALSEHDQLYCFEVYPENANEEIKSLFWEYDKAFACALGVPLHNPDAENEHGDGSEEGSIAFLLAKDWWYDGAVKVG